MMRLKEKIQRQSIKTVPWYKEGRDDIPVPVLGPDILDLRRKEEVKRGKGGE